jgi:alpha-amylase
MYLNYSARMCIRIAIAALAAALAAVTVAHAQPADLSPVPQRSGGPPLPAHWQHGAFMEIFVRAYADSDGDGIGDLQGLTSRLDYLKDLGVTGLWLMPVTKSADHDHGYATADYRAIEPAYGTLADFDTLIREARGRGIGIVIDYVVNHSAAEHPLFVEARKGPSNPYRDWYVWSDEAPQGWDIWDKNPWYWTPSQPWTLTLAPKDLPPAPPGAKDWYFGTFGPRMPDFNMRNPKVVAFHESNLRFWLNRGLGGYRLDAVPHLIENNAKDWNDQPESRRLTFAIQRLVKRYPNRFVVCEATAAPRDYGDPKLCGGAFAFGYVHHFVGAAKGSGESVAELARYYRSERPTMATFVSNHDTFAGARLWDAVQGDAARYKLAAAGYLLQPGTPFIYYGEEVGQAAVPGLEGDGPIRSPMSWTPQGGFTSGTPFRPVSPNAATQNADSGRSDPGSILAFYKAMLKLRNGRPSIARGRFDASFADGLVLGFQRRLGRETTLVLINYGSEAADATVRQLPDNAALRPAYPAGGAPLKAGPRGTLTLRLPPLSVQVYDVRG